MISLKEILHTAKDENKSGLVPYEEWTIAETDHLSDMGFKPNGTYCMGLENPPMVVFRKKEGFQLKDGKKKQNFKFQSFDQLVEYFDNYQQDLKNK
jgi:hypothetical protein